jgi:predicted membrane channel-forming protein YqfA (hemolysin III family)
MNRLTTVLIWLVVGLVILAAIAPILLRLAHALVPLIVVGGIAACVVRAVWFYTRRW